jgi:hypothetical protein
LDSDTKLTTFWRGNVSESPELNDCKETGGYNLGLILVKWVASWKVFGYSSGQYIG